MKKQNNSSLTEIKEAVYKLEIDPNKVTIILLDFNAIGTDDDINYFINGFDKPVLDNCLFVNQRRDGLKPVVIEGIEEIKKFIKEYEEKNGPNKV